MNDRTRLEQAAIDAHDRGDTWAEWWEQHRHAVGRIEPYDNRAYRRLVNRLLMLVVSGDTDGQHPAGDPEPWQADDEAPMVPIDDTTTAARCLWQTGRGRRRTDE